MGGTCIPEPGNSKSRRRLITAPLSMQGVRRRMLGCKKGSWGCPWLSQCGACKIKASIIADEEASSDRRRVSRCKSWGCALTFGCWKCKVCRITEDSDEDLSGSGTKKVTRNLDGNSKSHRRLITAPLSMQGVRRRMLGIGCKHSYFTCACWKCDACKADEASSDSESSSGPKKVKFNLDDNESFSDERKTKFPRYVTDASGRCSDGCGGTTKDRGKDYKRNMSGSRLDGAPFTCATCDAPWSKTS